MPVFFHNLRGCDSHFIMQYIGQVVRDNKFKNSKGEEKELSINCIPNDMDRCMSITLGNSIVFTDGSDGSAVVMQAWRVFLSSVNFT